MAELVELLRALLCSDNAARNSAEQRYAQLKSEKPQALVAGLLQVHTDPRAHVEPAVREQAVVLLRQCLSKIHSQGSIWSKLVFEPSQLDVLSKLLKQLVEEHDKVVRRKIADCIQSLANELVDIPDFSRPRNAQQWPDLMPTLMQIVTDQARCPDLRADALWIVKEITGTVWPLLVASAQQSVEVIRGCLVEADEPVRATAACLFYELIGHIESKEERNQFQSLLPVSYEVLKSLAQSSESRQMKLVLQAMCSTIDDCAEFYKDLAGTHLCPVLCSVAKAHGEDEVRRLALEVLCSFAEGKPKMVSKIENFLAAIFDVCVCFLMELKDEGWGDCDNDDEGAEGDEQHDFGAEVVDRIGGALHKAERFPQALVILQPAIAQLLQQGQWQSVVAGLVLLRQIVEYVDDEEKVVHMLEAVKAQVRAPHAQVRHAAWGCLEELAKDQGEVLASEEWVAALLPEFLAGLDDQCTRNVRACMGAFQHYGENVDRDSLEPFVQALMVKLGQHLQAAPSSIQREAITFIAVIARQIEDGFALYYSDLMPMLKQLIGSIVHKVEERVLLGKAFECVSLLANAVGKDVFKADAELIMGAMIQAAQAQQGAAKNDPITEYTMSAAMRLCSTLKEDFLPYLPQLLPVVLSKMALAPKECQDACVGEEADASLMIVPDDSGEAKVFAISSSELEDVQHAIECVHSFVESFGSAYAPFAAQTANALLPVFEYASQFSSRLCDLTFETWGQLCHCAKDAGNNQLVADLVLEFMRKIVPKLDSDCVAVAANPRGLRVTEATRIYADGITACLREAGPGILSGEQVEHICRLTLKVLETSFAWSSVARSNRQIARSNPDDSDDEDEEEADKELLRQSACNCATAIMIHHPDLFVAHGLPTYVALTQRLIQPANPAGDRRLGIYVASSFCEHLDGNVVPHWPSLMPQLLQDITCANMELRSPACYAMSFAARQAAFEPLVTETTEKLADVIVSARTIKGGKQSTRQAAQMAADNALSALMEILIHHETRIDSSRSAQLWRVWVDGLPCQEDVDEGVRNHGMLVQLVQKQKFEIIGVDGAHVPRLLSLLIGVYKTEMADDIANLGIGRLLLGVGETRLEQYAVSFTDKQRKKLVRAVREARRSASC